MVYPQMTDQ